MRCIYTSLVAVGFFFLSCFLAHAEPVRIVLSLEKAPNIMIEKKWSLACQQLTKHFAHGLGGLGLGIFSKISCEKPQIGRAQLDSPHSWTLNFVITKKLSYINLWYSDGSQNSKEMQISIVAGLKFLNELAKPNVAFSLAQSILSRAPITSQISGASLDSPLLPLKFVDRALIADQYLVFDNRFRDGTWIAKPIGVLRLIKTVKKTAILAFEPIGQPKVSHKKTYAIVSFNGRSFYASAADAKSKIVLSDTFDLDLLSKLDFILDIGSSFASMRYGKPLIQDTSILSKVAMVAIFAEARSGPFEGLRWYWEFAPKASQIISEANPIKEEFTWSRAAFGYSLGMDMPDSLSILFKRFDFVFKLGLLDLDGRFLSGDDPDIADRVTFKAKNVVNYGAEFGIEQEFGEIRSRMMVGLDRADSRVSFTGSDIDVTTVKGSIDLYWNFGNINKLEMSLISFLQGEQIEIARVKVDPNAGSGALGLAYAQGFLGLGISIGW